jgi:hypothetical protein
MEGAYTRNPLAEKHLIGKDKTWEIERKHLTLRTRIKRLTRKTICFSKSILMHNIVVGLFINRFEFGFPDSLINKTGTPPTFATNPDQKKTQVIRLGFWI